MGELWGAIACKEIDEVITGLLCFNTLRSRQNGHHFSDDILKWLSLNENLWITIKISLKFVLRGPINNIPALVQIMAWRWPGDKPLSEPIMVSLLTHICASRPQWIQAGIACWDVGGLFYFIQTINMTLNVGIHVCHQCFTKWLTFCRQHFANVFLE